MALFRVALAQINTTVGDLDGNAEKIERSVEAARKAGADLVAFPELTIPGYPPEDLVFKQQFIDDNLAVLRRLASGTRGITAIVGFIDRGQDAYNAAAVVADGEIAGVYRKIFLPNYGVFDEDRYFRAGTDCPVYVVGGTGIGLNICEDIWYPVGPTVVQAQNGAEVIVNINASPYQLDKAEYREKFVATRAIDNGVFVCYVNLVGGQDELVFDGASMIWDPRGNLVARGHTFEEDLVIADLDVDMVRRNRAHNPLQRKQHLVPFGDEVTSSRTVVSADQADRARPPVPQRDMAAPEPLAATYAALVTGTRDYVRKSGFERVLIGLSGGIDSSLVATVATDALGPEGVVGIAMPSRYNAPESLEDAQALAKNCGFEFHALSIEPTFEAMLSTLAGMFEGTEPNVAEENVQARIRGNILMAISNKFGWIVLTTGNKSEMAMGYATLYGDMAGGFAVIKDVPKTLVYDLARYRNSTGDRAVIPPRVIEKPPSAELRPDQTDQDSLPPYPVLDSILMAYVEEDRPFDAIVAMGHPEATVRQVISGVDRNEYKRRQAPPGVKITPRAFGRDRRLPIVNRYRAF